MLGKRWNAALLLSTALLSQAAARDSWRYEAGAIPGSAEDPVVQEAQMLTPQGLEQAVDALRHDYGADDVRQVRPLLGLGRMELHSLVLNGVVAGPYDMTDFRGTLYRPPFDNPNLMKYQPLQFRPRTEYIVREAARIAYDHCNGEVELCIEALIQYGDWLWIARSHSKALEYYLRASVVIRQYRGAHDNLARALDAPVRLLYPMDPEEFEADTIDTARADVRTITLRLTVLGSGSARQVVVLDDGGLPAVAKRMKYTYGHAVFRPIIVDGEPIVTTGFIYQHKVLVPLAK